LKAHPLTYLIKKSDMKYSLILLLTLLAFYSKQAKAQKKSPLDNALRYLDSNLRYGRMSMDYKSKRDSTVILYYKTEDEKFRIQANAFDALRVRYAKKANLFYDSLQMASKH
jgi:hypothetical protein